LSGAIAKRYAAALADVVLEQNVGDRAKAELLLFVNAFSSSADLRNFLESPAISEGAKQKAIEGIASRMGMDAAVRNFVFLIVQHRRTEMLHEMQVAFDEELNARMGIALAEVVSATALNDQQKNELKQALERRTGKRIEARYHEDRTLLGGTIVRIGSVVYDGSVRERLARMREQLERE